MADMNSENRTDDAVNSLAACRDALHKLTAENRRLVLAWLHQEFKDETHPPAKIAWPPMSPAPFTIPRSVTIKPPTDDTPIVTMASTLDTDKYDFGFGTQ